MPAKAQALLVSSKGYTSTCVAFKHPAPILETRPGSNIDQNFIGFTNGKKHRTGPFLPKKPGT